MKEHPIQRMLSKLIEGKRQSSIRSLMAVTFAAFIVDVMMLLLQSGDPFSVGTALLPAFLFSIHLVLLVLVIRTVKQSLDAAAEEEEKFRRLFQTSPVAVSITSLDEGRLIDANSAYWKLTGCDPSTSIGRTPADLGVSSTESERAMFIDQLKSERSLKDPSYEFKSASGESRVAAAFYELIQWGKQPAVLAMFQDTTEQRKVQQALQSSEIKYRNFIEQSMEGIWLLGFDQPISLALSPEEQTELIYQYGFVQECNDTVAHMYGYNSSDEFRGVRLWDAATGKPLDMVNRQATLQLVKDGYRSAHRETMERTRDGEVVYFLNNAVGIIQDDCLAGLWGTQLDITALKKADDALRRSEARTRGLLNAIPDMIFELSREGTILQFMPSTVNTPLMKPEQFLNRTVAEVLPVLADQTTFAIERALESGLVNAFEYELENRSELRVFEARFSASGADTVLVMIRDVTLRRWAQTERDKLIEELEAKNAELERFAYTVSHDLKSPLITIRGFLGFLREDSHSGNFTRLDSDIQRISAATEKMQTLLNDLLELSRVGRLINKPELVPLHEIVTEAVELVHGRISQGGIAVSISNDLPSVYVDHPRVVEVMQNLIDNASKFMGSQPSPRIEIGQQGFMNGMPLFYVRDNGIGIPQEFMHNIFGLFNKLDPRSEGTGIGLALVKRIIEFHHGTIWAESEPGRGATFFFTLPATAIHM